MAACGLTPVHLSADLSGCIKQLTFFIYLFFGTADHVSTNGSELWSSREPAQLGNLYCDLIFAFTAGKARGVMSSKSQQ